MPLMQMKLMEKICMTTQKKEIVSGFADAMVSIEGENMRPVTRVAIEEVCSGEWSIGGHAMTTDSEPCHSRRQLTKPNTLEEA